jgi:sugar lactone lactonase YvrE
MTTEGRRRKRLARGLVVTSVAAVMSLAVPAVASADFSFLKTWGEHGICSSNCSDGQLHQNEGITVDAAGNVWVADGGNDRIQKYDAQGNFLLKFGSNGTGDGQFKTPDAIDATLDSAGNIVVYVGETDGHRIQKFDANGNFILKWGKNGGDGTSGFGNGEFNDASGVATDSAGNVYVADADNYRIQKFDSNGNFLLKWGKVDTGTGEPRAGKLPGEFAEPVGIGVDSANNVYVTDRACDNTAFIGIPEPAPGRSRGDPGCVTDPSDEEIVNQRVQKFDSNGNYLMQWGDACDPATPKCSAPFQFHDPYGVTTDGFRNVYVADVNNKRVQSFTANGDFLKSFSMPEVMPGPSDVATDCRNNLYVANELDEGDPARGVIKFGEPGAAPAPCGPPASAAAVPACSTTGAISVTLTQNRYGQPPKAVHYRIDAGAEQTVATSGNPGIATVQVPNGVHVLEFWGESTGGDLEPAHHATTVVVDTVNGCRAPVSVSPSLAIAGVRGVRGSCTRTDFRPRFAFATTSRIRSVVVYLDGRRIATSSRATFSVLVRASKLKAGTHRLRVVATDATGRRITRTQTFKRCARAARARPRFTG